MSGLQESIDREYRYLLDLKDGTRMVKYSESVFRCPFCSGDRDYGYQDLLRHANAVGENSCHFKDVRNIARHLALERYIREDLRPRERPEPASTSVVSSRDGDQKYACPWKGILANTPRTYKKEQRRYVGGSESKLKEDLISKGFNPHKVRTLWNNQDSNTGFAIVSFGEGWEGFSNATMFDKHFEVNHCGKKDYYAARDRGDQVYGWMAKEDDYYARNIFGEYLRERGDLKSVSGKEAEDARKTVSLVLNLANTLETKSTNLEQMESKYKETSTALEIMPREKDEMINKHNEKMSSMQQTPRDYVTSIYQEHEKASRRQRKEYEQREKYLDKCQAVNKTERRKLQWQKQKVAMYSRRELEDWEYRYYSDLKNGTRKVKYSESVFRCPFCSRDRDYEYQDLLRHVSAIGGSSHTKDVQDRVRHLALKRYMRKYLRPRETPEPASTSVVSSSTTEEGIERH